MAEGLIQHVYNMLFVRLFSSCFLSNYYERVFQRVAMMKVDDTKKKDLKEPSVRTALHKPTSKYKMHSFIETSNMKIACKMSMFVRVCFLLCYF